MLLAALIAAEFMLQIVGTMMNVAVPNVQADLGLSVSTASWALNGFFLAFGGFMILGGRLGDVFGHRRMFLFGVGLLTVASLVSGLAPGIEILLIGRVLQGLACAIAAPTGLALLAILFHGDRQKRALALYSTVSAFGSGAGLVIGGIFTYLGDWRWSLLVSVPIGVAVIAVAFRVLDLGNDTTEDRSLGLLSSILVTAGVTSGVYGLVRASQMGWTDSTALLSFAGFAILLIALLAVDSRSNDPLLPTRVFANRDRVGSFVNLVLIASVMGSLFFYMSVYMSAGLGFNSLQIGLGYLPYGIAIVLTTEVLTRWMGSISLKVRGLAGLICMAVAAFLLAQLGEGSTYAANVLPELTLLGIGVGLAIIPLYTIIMTTTPPEDSGVTAGVLQVTINTGGTIGLAILLTPSSAGGGSVTENISEIFVWGGVIAVINVLVNLVLWFGPRSKTRGHTSSAS
ncbi:MFS transporter [Rhodococcus sp. SC4]|nr:MFS transporter [Rhodococcus sp. SC4]